MATPKEILAVERPKNTVVVTYGKNHDLYAVRKRIGCRRVNGRNLPVTGPTVGHIVGGRYVAIADAKPKVAAVGATVDLKDWGGVAVCERLFSDMLDELREVYRPEDALKFYCIAVLRACYPGVKDYELAERYEGSFLSVLRPGAALSRNTVSAFVKNAGKSCGRIVRFMRRRAAAVCADGDHVLVDGTLKTDTSTVNSLSDFSRKARTKGSRDISVLQAFDLEKMEPVCSKCFPGNMLDATAYEEFVRECGVRDGILVGDKGFPSAAVEGPVRESVTLHYLNPIKRNSQLVRTYGLLSFEGKLPAREGVVYKKVKCKDGDGGKWLYSYRDVRMAADEERAYLARLAPKDYDADAYAGKRDAFGTIVLESDLDLPPEIAHGAYEDRWMIELVMRFYKSACEFDDTRVHSDYSVIGSEFCDFLATVLTWRLIKAFTKSKLLDKLTYKRVMTFLRRAKMVKVGDGDWQPVKVAPAVEKALAALSLDPKDAIVAAMSDNRAK